MKNLKHTHTEERPNLTTIKEVSTPSASSSFNMLLPWASSATYPKIKRKKIYI